jgi:D-alanyl-D-alanine carboxypeptidase
MAVRPRSRCSDRVLRFVLPTVLVAFALVLPGCGGETSGAPPPPVEEVARQIARDGAKSAIVFVSDDGREYAATAGTRRPGKDQRFRVGSVTKTFTATIVLQLVAEGKLRLSDPLERHLPGIVPGGKKITIRQLLNHRSGLANFTDYPEWLQRASRSSSTRPIDSLRFAAAQPLVFAPGSEWDYSNSNYIALGLIIEKTTGTTYREELERRILDPLALERTELPRTLRLRDLDDEGENPNLSWAAGALVSDTHDLARFFSALLSGQLLSDGSLAQMKQTIVVDGYDLGNGLGIFSNKLPCGRFWLHDGAIVDYGTIVAASDDGNRVAVISARRGRDAPPLDTPVTAVLCPLDTTNSP